MQSGALRVDVKTVRRPLWGVLTLAVLAAASAAIALWWLPAARARDAEDWRKSGERATAAVLLPARFQSFHILRDGSSSVSCSPRCFVAPGQPRANMGAVVGALREVATARMQVRCGPDGGFAVAPDKCRVVVPVRGSRLDVFVYARFHQPRGAHRPVRAEDFDGTIVAIGVSPPS